MNKFEFHAIDQLELNGKPATVPTIVNALFHPDYEVHDPNPIMNTSTDDDFYICGCWICQSLVPALYEIKGRTSDLEQQRDDAHSTIEQLQTENQELQAALDAIEAARLREFDDYQSTVNDASIYGQ